MYLSSHAIFTASDYARQGKLIEMQKNTRTSDRCGCFIRDFDSSGQLVPGVRVGVGCQDIFFTRASNRTDEHASFGWLG